MNRALNDNHNHLQAKAAIISFCTFFEGKLHLAQQKISPLPIHRGTINIPYYFKNCERKICWDKRNAR